MHQGEAANGILHGPLQGIVYDFPALALVPPAQDFGCLLEEEGRRLGIIVAHQILRISGTIAVRDDNGTSFFSNRRQFSFSSLPPPFTATARGDRCRNPSRPNS